MRQCGSAGSCSASVCRIIRIDIVFSKCNVRADLVGIISEYIVSRITAIVQPGIYTHLVGVLAVAFQFYNCPGTVRTSLSRGFSFDRHRIPTLYGITAMRAGIRLVRYNAGALRACNQ